MCHLHSYHIQIQMYLQIIQKGNYKNHITLSQQIIYRPVAQVCLMHERLSVVICIQMVTMENWEDVVDKFLFRIIRWGADDSINLSFVLFLNLKLIDLTFFLFLFSYTGIYKCLKRLNIILCVLSNWFFSRQICL